MTAPDFPGFEVYADPNLEPVDDADGDDPTDWEQVARDRDERRRWWG